MKPEPHPITCLNLKDGRFIPVREMSKVPKTHLDLIDVDIVKEAEILESVISTMCSAPDTIVAHKEGNTVAFFRNRDLLVFSDNYIPTEHAPLKVNKVY